MQTPRLKKARFCFWGACLVLTVVMKTRAWEGLPHQRPSMAHTNLCSHPELEHAVADHYLVRTVIPPRSMKSYDFTPEKSG
jgi:hypothetical protein